MRLRQGKLFGLRLRPAIPVSVIEQRRGNKGRAHGHDDHYSISLLVDYPESQADLRYHHADLAPGHHADSDAQHAYPTELPGTQPAADKFAQHSRREDA